MGLSTELITKANWPPLRDSSADILRVSPSSIKVIHSGEGLIMLEMSALKSLYSGQFTF